MKKIAIVTALLTLLLSACAPTVDTTPSPQATASASVVPDASAKRAGKHRDADTYRATHNAAHNRGHCLRRRIGRAV